MSVSRSFVLVYFLSALSSIWVFLGDYHDFVFAPVVKCMPIWLLLGYLIYASNSIFRTVFIGLGLLCGSLGDAVLCYPGKSALAGGALFFLIAQLFYSSLLIKNFKYEAASLYRNLFVFVAWIFLCFTSFVGLHDLKIIFIVYVTALCFMTFLAQNQVNNDSYLMVGALSFLISDSLILFDIVWCPIEFRVFLVFSTYYLAQFFIATRLQGSVAPIIISRT